jgi:hypothetical protein
LIGLTLLAWRLFMALAKKKKDVKVTVTCPTAVWTSAGKLYSGDTATIPADEAAELKKRKLVK